MVNTYLDSMDTGGNKAGTVGIIAALYGWATLDMAADIRHTGRAIIPGTGKLFNEGKGIGSDLLARGVFKNKNAKMFDPIGDMLYGTTFRSGGSAFGKATLAASSAAKYTLTGLSFVDPWYFAATNLTKPAMWPIGIAWFGGLALLGNAAKGLRRNQARDFGNSFVDSGQTYTSRQRAVRAIAESHLQARSAIGNEAMLMHRSNG